MKFTKLILVSFLALAFTSCLVDDEENELRDFDNTPQFVQFERDARSVNFVVDLGDDQDYNLPILLSRASSSNITVTWHIESMDPDVYPDYAEEGVEYDVNATSPMTIEAGETFGTIPLTVHTANLDPDNAKYITVVIDEISASGYIISEDFKSIDLTLQGICQADLAGTYVMTNDVCPGTSQEVQIIDNGDGTFDITEADGGLLHMCSTNDIANPGTISILCGGIVAVDTQPVYCGYADGAIGCIDGGMYNAETGTLTMEHSQSFFGWAGSTYTSTYVKQ
ncbi:hypothetical protein [Mangrovimonas cancribranchiae]